MCLAGFCLAHCGCGCVGQDTRETGWGLAREIRNSNLGKSEVTVGQEGKVCS